MQLSVVTGLEVPPAIPEIEEVHHATLELLPHKQRAMANL
jgi:hypothetical protein